jgi:8-oxo-dGTP diphosphatase
MDAQPKRMSSAAMLLENAAGELLIVKANYKDYWTLPGGIVDDGETPKQAAIRETFEEVGLTIDPTDVSFVAVIDRSGDTAHTYQFIFKAPMSPDVQPIKLQASEIDEYAFVSKTTTLSNDRRYAKAILHWASNDSGYLEQTFDRDKEGLA